MPWHLCYPEHTWTPGSTGMASTAPPTDKRLWWSHNVRIQLSWYKYSLNRCDTLCNWTFSCRAIQFAVFHICTVLFTVSLSLAMGVITGKSSLYQHSSTFRKDKKSILDDTIHFGTTLSPYFVLPWNVYVLFYCPTCCLFYMHCAWQK